MLVTVIDESNINNITYIVNIHSKYTDIFELRIDCLENLDISKLKTVREQIIKPIIFTVRAKSEHGGYTASEESRLKLIYDLCSLKPEYIDLENYVDIEFISRIKQDYPNIKIISSYHNFTNTPDDLNTVLYSMSNKYTDVYKIIGYATSSLDTIRILEFIYNNKKNINLVAHCMGEYGEPSRVLGKIAGNYFTYCSTCAHSKSDFIKGNSRLYITDDTESKSKHNAPGLIEVDKLINIYNIKNLNQNTTIYGLLGSPVSRSHGHIYHNDNFVKNNINSVYVKFLIDTVELEEFLSKIKSSKLKYSGFSVTMPLKYDTVKYMDYIDNNLLAVNTIKVKNKLLYGINTDGAGAIDAIESHINNSINNYNIIILGAGGAASAVAQEACARGADVTILNRSLKKAKAVGDYLLKTNSNFKIKSYDYNGFKSPSKKYTIIVNALPATIDTINNTELYDYVLALSNKSNDYNKTVYMNINYGDDFDIAGLNNINGIKMFENQAKLQYKYWMHNGK